MLLVTGGNGNIGKAICSDLKKRGHEVISIGRRQLETKLYTHVQCDITNEKEIKDLFKKYPISSVFHLAGMTNTASRRNPNQAVRINVMGSLNIMEIAMAEDIPFIYGSSLNAIGETLRQEERGVKEDDISFPQEFYGYTKRFVEEMGIALANTKGLKFTSLRIPNIVGKGQGSANSPWREELFTQMGKGGEISIGYSGDSYLPLAHIDDLTAAIEEVILTKKKSRNIYNLPAETLRLSDLKVIVETLDPNIKVTLGEGKTEGMPQYIDWQAYRDDYHVATKTIRERLEEALIENTL